MESRKVTFTARNGATLTARIDSPPGEPVATALFAYCFTCARNRASSARLSRALCELGVAVLRFDFTGRRAGNDADAQDAEDVNFTSEVEDLVAAADVLAREHQPPQLLVGHSIGGTALLHAASRIPSARALATVNAPYGPRHAARLFAGREAEIDHAGEAEVTIEGRRFRITRDLVRELEGLSSREVVRSLRLPMLFLHAPGDEVVGIENARRLFLAARGPRSFVSLDAADHLLSEPAEAEYAGRVIVAWASRHLVAPGLETSPAREPADPAADAAADAMTAEEGAVLVRLGDERYRTEILASGHELLADEPVSIGGGNVGATPYDLLVAALGACTAMTLRMYADRKGWPLEEVRVRLRHHRKHATDERYLGAREAKMDRIETEVDVRGALDDEQRARLLEIAGKCPVRRTLIAGVEVSSELATDAVP